MAKALIIKGANFSTNKVTTISFGDDVPCTGVSFASDEISISSYTPVNAEYTVSPANTTDSVTWASSNTDIVTVANGVITPVGIGSCTITVTCGNFSDTAIVTVTLAYIPSYTFGQISYNGTDPNDFPTIADSQNRIAVCGSGAQAGTYKCYGKNGASDANIIKLPKNTASVTVKNTTKSYIHDGTYTRFYWLIDQSCGATGFTDYATFVEEKTLNFYTTQEMTYEVPEGVDACMFMVRTSSSYTSSDDPATIMSNMGFSLTFNAAVVT